MDKKDVIAVFSKGSLLTTCLGKSYSFGLPFTPGLATQLWSDGYVASGVYIFQDIAKVWS